MPRRHRRWNAGSTTCSLSTPSRARRTTRMADASLLREDVYREPIDAAQFGVVAKPLSAWERIYNQAAVRKLVLLVVLAAAWEIYARWLDNPLLFPTFGATVEAFFD